MGVCCRATLRLSLLWKFDGSRLSTVPGGRRWTGGNAVRVARQAISPEVNAPRVPARSAERVFEPWRAVRGPTSTRGNAHASHARAPAISGYPANVSRRTMRRRRPHRQLTAVPALSKPHTSRRPGPVGECAGFAPTARARCPASGDCSRSLWSPSAPAPGWQSEGAMANLPTALR